MESWASFRRSDMSALVKLFSRSSSTRWVCSAWSSLRVPSSLKSDWCCVCNVSICSLCEEDVTTAMRSCLRMDSTSEKSGVSNFKISRFNSTALLSSLAVAMTMPSALRCTARSSICICCACCTSLTMAFRSSTSFITSCKRSSTRLFTKFSIALDTSPTLESMVSCNALACCSCISWICCCTISCMRLSSRRCVSSSGGGATRIMGAGDAIFVSLIIPLSWLVCLEGMLVMTV
mmetsp:Transcript_45961/g.127581  ORF Transcript_45961/g.127581 Transcript_45961/m.127581 type:complete len:234 (-) Transcript_45961:302-1003(-)